MGVACKSVDSSKAVAGPEVADGCYACYTYVAEVVAPDDYA